MKTYQKDVYMGWYRTKMKVLMPWLGTAYQNLGMAAFHGRVWYSWCDRQFDIFDFICDFLWSLFLVMPVGIC